MTKKDYLTAFGNSPCAPIILLPGIGGSNLQVVIDCAKLRASSPQVFADCGWDACASDADYLANPANKSVPNSEYLVWVPHIISPMTIFNPTDKTKRCFGGLVGLQYDISPDGIKIRKVDGLDVKIVGTTPQTRKKSAWDCGMDGILDIIKDIPEPHELTYYKNAYEKLLYLGYISGLTAQALPYDFRADNRNDALNGNYFKVIQELYSMINKKIVILAHSMGNLRTYDLLTSLSQSDRDKYIKLYIAAAPPLVGVAEVNKYLMCGSEEYHFVFNLGIDFPTFKASLGTFSSMYQLLPNDYLAVNQGKPWLQKVQARIQYERGQSQDPVFSWMPKRDEVCYSKYPSRPNCISGLERPDNYGTILG